MTGDGSTNNAPTGCLPRGDTPTPSARPAFPCVEIVGVPVIDATRAQITKDMVSCAMAPYERCHTLFFLNAYGCNLTFLNADYARALEHATWVLNDGIGMDIAAWLKGRTFTENLNGSDLIDEGEFLHQCARLGAGVFLLGGRESVLDIARIRYSERFPGLRIVGAHHGYFDHVDEEDSLAVIGRINASGADVLLAGLGNPLQELWLDKYRSRLTCKLAIGIGGSIDQVSGAVPRAPRPWIRLRLEWLYRLLQEPGRLWRRYLIGNPRFIIRALMRRQSKHVAPRVSS